MSSSATTTTLHQQPIVAGTTPNNVRKNSTSSHDKHGSIELNTCCGSIAMSPSKCLVITVLILNIFAFCVLLGLLIDVYIGKINQKLDYITKRGEALLYAEILSCSSRIAASTSNNNVTDFFVARYDEYHPKYMTLMNEILNLVPASAVGDIQHGTQEVNNITRDEAVVMEEEAIAFVKQGEKDEALEILDGEEYAFEKEDYEDDLHGYTDYLRNEELRKNEVTNSTTLACLILVCCLMAMVLPVVVISLLASFNREKQEREKLERAKAIVLNDTMADGKLRELFKKHCEQEFSMENFLLLERIAEYRELCERSFEIQVFLYDSSTSDEVSTNSGSTTKTATSMASASTRDSNTHKKGNSTAFTEKDLEIVENQKRELAQNMYDQFLLLNGIMAVNVNKKIADDILHEIQTVANYHSHISTTGMTSTDLEMNSIGASDVANTTASGGGSVGGSHHHGSHTLILTESLFDVLENEIQIVMLDTHTRFKQSLAFHKKMKIENIQKKMNTQQQHSINQKK